MAQPTPYERTYSFNDAQAADPTAIPSGSFMDAEFNAIATTAGELLANIALIQRDDGDLANNSVGLDQLTTSVVALLTASAGWTVQGAWVTDTAYAALDLVSEGTGTYVCAVAHTSGVFATDLTADKWVLLFDSSGSTPADGSVTSSKLGPGAVTTAKIGFTLLDLAGAIRGGGGIAAGTAALGSLFAAKTATGDVYGRVDRTTDAQGAVGFQIGGVGQAWTLEQATSSDDLAIRSGAVIVATFREAGGIDTPGTVRATAGLAPADGNGVGLMFASNIGYLTSYDYGAGTWRALKVRGLTVTLTAGAVDVLAVSSTGVTVTGTFAVNGNEMGYLGVPQVQDNDAYTLILSDAGKHIYSENVAGQTITVPTNASVAFPIGTAIWIVNDGTNSITVPMTGIVIRLAGTTTVTGSRTITAGGMATLLKVDTDRWFISGTGVS